MFELNLSDVRPSVISFLVVGVMAITFIVLAKYVVNTYDNVVTDFFRDTVNAV